ncbi:unnamed protein product, partial [Brassica oleracea]
APACDVINLLVSTILKPRTLEVFVVSLDGLSLTRAGQSSSSHISLPRSILSIPHVCPPPPFRWFKLGSIPPEDSCHQPPQTYLISRLSVTLASDVGGNPLRRTAFSHLFVNLASDVGGNPLRRPALSHQKLVRSQNTSDSFPSFNFSLLTGLLPCGAVCTGLEGAIETTSVFLVGEDCLSTSLVTIAQLSDFVMQALSTHSSLFMNCLQEDV